MFTALRIFFNRLFHQPKFSISGNAGTKGVGVTKVICTGIETLLSADTATDGSFSFTELAAGTYRILPVPFQGHYFTPNYKDIVISDADVVDVTFIDPTVTGKFGLGLSLANWNNAMDW